MARQVAGRINDVNGSIPKEIQGSCEWPQCPPWRGAWRGKLADTEDVAEQVRIEELMRCCNSKSFVKQFERTSPNEEVCVREMRRIAVVVVVDVTENDRVDLPRIDA